MTVTLKVKNWPKYNGRIGYVAPQWIRLQTDFSKDRVIAKLSDSEKVILIDLLCLVGAQSTKCASKASCPRTCTKCAETKGARGMVDIEMDQAKWHFRRNTNEIARAFLLFAKPDIDLIEIIRGDDEIKNACEKAVDNPLDNPVDSSARNLRGLSAETARIERGTGADSEINYETLVPQGLEKIRAESARNLRATRRNETGRNVTIENSSSAGAQELVAGLSRDLDVQSRDKKRRPTQTNESRWPSN